jgi:hypothetical protein
LTFLAHLGKVLDMMRISPKLIAGAGSFVVAGVAAVLLGTAGLASSHSTATVPPAAHQRVAIGAAAVGLTLAVKPAPVHIAVKPLKAKVTLTSATKPAKVTRSDPGSATCPNMGGSGGYDPGKHHNGGKPGGH